MMAGATARKRRLTEALGALRESFRNRGLRRLQLAWAGCTTADLAQDVALSVYVFDVQGVTGVGLVGMARALPAGVLGPLVTGVADRHPRHRVLAGVLVARMVLLGALAGVLVTEGPVALVYVLTAADAIVYTLYWPAHSSLTLELARTPEELTAANVAATSVENLGILVGPLLAGLLLALSGPGSVLAASAGIVALAAAAVLKGWGPSGPVRAGAQGPSGPVRAGAGGPPRRAAPAADRVRTRLFGGFVALAHDRVSLAVVLLYLVQVLCLGALSVLIVVLALDVLGTGQAGVGILTAVAGLGGVLGSVVALGLVGRRHLTRPLGLSLALWGAALATVAVAPWLAVAVGALVLVGAATAVVDVAAVSLLQRVVPERVLARVLGVVEGGWWATFGLGSLGVAFLVDVTGPRTGLAVTAGVSLLAAAVAPRVLRSADARAQPPEQAIAALGAVPMLAALPPLAIERLAQKAVAVTVAPGEVVAGPVGLVHVVEEGRLQVGSPSGERELGPGDWFGDVGLSDGAQTVTARATGTARLLALDRDDLLAVVAAHPPPGHHFIG